MKKVILLVVLFIYPVILIGCGEPQDRLHVNWTGDERTAIVTVKYAADGSNKSWKLRCGEQNTKFPYMHEWENDCDLDIVFNGHNYEFDCPADEDDEENYTFEDTDSNTSDVALGMGMGVLVGDALNYSSKKKTKKKTKSENTYKYKPTTKPTSRYKPTYTTKRSR